MWRERRICVVIPAFNERALIGRTLRNIPEYVDQVLVVDDASTDDTCKAVEAVQDRRVELLRHSDNRGVGAAITTGYLAALKADAEFVAVMAGDNQMSPNDLPKLLDAALAGADYVKGNRFIHPLARQMPAHRRWGSRWLSLLTRELSGLAVDDCQCGYTVLSAQAAKSLPLALLWPRYGYPNDLLLMLAAFGRTVEEVSVEPCYGSEQSGLHAGHLLSISWRILKRQRYFQMLAAS